MEEETGNERLDEEKAKEQFGGRTRNRYSWPPAPNAEATVQPDAGETDTTDDNVEDDGQ